MKSKKQKFQLMVWGWASGKPKMHSNHVGITERQKFNLRTKYENEGFEVHSWPL